MWNWNLSGVCHENPWWILSINGVHSIMSSFQNKSSWRNSWCSLWRTSWLGSSIARAWSASSPVFSVVYWSSDNLCNCVPLFQLIHYFSWFKNYNTYIILLKSTCLLRKYKTRSKVPEGDYSRAHGAGKPAGRKTLDITWHPKDNSRKEKDWGLGKNANENVDHQSGQLCHVSKEQDHCSAAES